MNTYSLNPALKDSLSLFNPNRLPEVYNVPESYTHYIFMTRPDLNIFDSGGNPLANWKSLDSYAYHLLNGDNREITKSLTDRSSTIFLPVITSKYRGGYQVDSRTLKSLEKGTTYQGNSVQYAVHSTEHRRKKNFTIEYENDRNLIIWKIHAAWRDYIDIITFRTNFSPKRSYIYPTPTLDYAASMYYFVTKRDGRPLVSWEKMYGVLPENTSDDIFSGNNRIIFEPTISISYVASIKSEPNSMAVLEDFNTLTSGKSKVAIELTEKRINGGLAPKSVFAKYPFLTKHASKNEYYLNWGGEA